MSNEPYRIGGYRFDQSVVILRKRRVPETGNSARKKEEQ